MYKIINKKGLYSTGGVWPRFEANGVVFLTLKGLKCHLTHLKDWHKENIYADCTVIQFTCTGIKEVFYIIFYDDEQRFELVEITTD
jgi:hypothetical protein